MDARSNFKTGIACDDLREWLALADMTHSVAVINACKPYHWRDKFRPAMHSAQKSPAKRASGSAGSLMAPKRAERVRAEMVRAEMVPQCRD
jgi:hypothetical protein